MAAPPLAKIGNHLSGDGLRVGRNGFRADTVVAGKYADVDIVSDWQLGALHAGPAASTMVSSGPMIPQAWSASSGAVWHVPENGRKEARGVGPTDGK